MSIDSQTEIRELLGWNEERGRQLVELADPTLEGARVTAESRGIYGLAGSVATSAVLAGRFRRPGHHGADWPAVGDWVAVRPSPGGGGVIHEVLPRASFLERRRPGAERAQPIAANVDVVFVVSSAGPELNPRRIERYLSLVWSSGARPVVVLNKADLCPEPEQVLADITALAPGVVGLASSSVSGLGLDRLRAEIGARGTAALLGSSGVGKSSLLNALLGEARQSTSSVRLADGKGRHTTTSRQLVALPDGGWVIDTPGMRELGLWDAESGIERAFEDISRLAEACRFRDCQHQGEPGCAVAAAMESGEIDEDRRASFDKLRREQAHQQRLLDPRQQQASKGRWKVIHKQMRDRRRVDPKLRDD